LHFRFIPEIQVAPISIGAFYFDLTTATAKFGNILKKMGGFIVYIWLEENLRRRMIKKINNYKYVLSHPF